MNASVLSYLEKTEVAASSPLVGAAYTEFLKLYRQKKWHQLTEHIDIMNKMDIFWVPGNKDLIRLYENAIIEFELKLNPVRLTQFIIQFAKQYEPNVQEALDFLEKFQRRMANWKSDMQRSASSLLSCVIAEHYGRLLNMDRCYIILKSIEPLLDSVPPLDSSCFAAYYKVACLYYKAKGDATLFYKHGIQYLIYQQDTYMSDGEKTTLAYDLAISSLVSPTHYDFAEMIMHPIGKYLQRDNMWLLDILQAFHTGNINMYINLSNIHAEKMTKEVSLFQNAQLLKEKISISTLIQLVFIQPIGERTLSFEKIASVTQLAIDEVELLVMKALSLKLLTGYIDQINQLVHIDWVKPRILDMSQIQYMATLMKTWISTVDKTLLLIEGETADI